MFRMAYNFNTQMTFKNGLTISFAIGEGNYCANRNLTSGINPYATYAKERESENCEIIVFDVGGNDLDIKQFLSEGITGDGNKVAGWISPDTLVEVMNNVKSWKE